MKIETLVAIGICGMATWRIIYWVDSAAVTADPWDAEVEEALHQKDAVELCHRCLTPQNPGGWFCPHCRAATGPYNNYLPYINLFSEGEVLRIGTTERVRPTFLIVAGYLFYSLTSYLIFAPVYWYYLFKNLKRQGPEPPSEGEEQAVLP